MRSYAYSTSHRRIPISRICVLQQAKQGRLFRCCALERVDSYQIFFCTKINKQEHNWNYFERKQHRTQSFKSSPLPYCSLTRIESHNCQIGPLPILNDLNCLIYLFLSLVTKPLQLQLVQRPAAIPFPLRRVRGRQPSLSGIY